jgi:ketosteroid isomerase-like protein
MAGNCGGTFIPGKTMKKLIVIIALIFVVSDVTRAQTEPPATSPDVDKAILQLREGLVDSFNRGDVDGLLTYLDTNAIVTWQNGEVCEGTAAVRAYYDRMMKGDKPIVKKITAEPKVLGRHVQGDGNWAISWGNLNDHFELTDGRKMDMNSRFTATIARRGDRWLVSAFHVSVNAFENPVMMLAVKKVALGAGIGGLLVGLVGGLLLARMLRRPQISKS